MVEVSGIAKAVEDAGGVPALARKLTEAGERVLPGSIYYWITTGEVPARRVRSVALVTGISAERLAPRLAKLAEAFGVTVE